MILIDAKTLRAWQVEKQSFILLDTLPATTYCKNHLPGAVNIVSDDIIALAPLLLADKEQVIVVYCGSVDCRRAGLSAERLESLGYGQIRHFKGGKIKWIAAGFPIESNGRDNAG